MLIAIPLVLVGYALGSLSASYYLTRLISGKDIRSLGSGNAGARNIGRVYGWKGFALVLILDAGKGALAAGLGLIFAGDLLTAILCGSAAVVGHNWPIQLGFKGGRGLATALGFALVVDPLLTALCALATIVVLVLWRKPAVSGLFGVVASPLVAIALQRTGAEIAGLAVLVVITLVAHRNDAAHLAADRVGQ